MRLAALALVVVTSVAAASGGRPPADAAAPDSGCGASVPAASCQQRLQTLDAELRRHIGAAACSTSSECRSLALGTKLCGGPAGYLAYSVTGVDQKELLRLADELNRLHRLNAEALARGGMASDCMLVTDPGAECRVGKCELRR